MSGSNQTSAFHWSNIFSSPMSTLIGIEFVVQTLEQNIQNGLPTTVGGWVQLAIGVALTLARAV